MNIQDVEKLALLSRIEMPSEEKEGILKDLESILGYIKQIESVSVENLGEAEPASPAGRLEFINIMREDNPPAGGPHKSGLFTEKILKEVPASPAGRPEVENGFVKVQAIL